MACSAWTHFAHEMYMQTMDDRSQIHTKIVLNYFPIDTMWIPLASIGECNHILMSVETIGSENAKSNWKSTWIFFFVFFIVLIACSPNYGDSITSNSTVNELECLRGQIYTTCGTHTHTHKSNRSFAIHSYYYLLFFAPENHCGFRAHTDRLPVSLSSTVSLEVTIQPRFLLVGSLILRE